MGYTHYWRVNKTKVKASEIERAYQKAIKEISQVVKYAKKNVVNLSGYTAHCKINQYGGINFNGVKDDACEDFTLREHFNENEGFNFCKTARYDYDIVVKAALAIFKYRLKDNIIISSDGNDIEWLDGVKLARKVLKLKIKNPITNE